MHICLKYIASIRLKGDASTPSWLFAELSLYCSEQCGFRATHSSATIKIKLHRITGMELSPFLIVKPNHCLLRLWFTQPRVSNPHAGKVLRFLLPRTRVTRRRMCWGSYMFIFKIMKADLALLMHQATSSSVTLSSSSSKPSGQVPGNFGYKFQSIFPNNPKSANMFAIDQEPALCSPKVRDVLW